MRVVIIGGGLAATRTVVELRRREVEADLTMLSAENVVPYDRPPLSKQALTGTAPPPLHDDWTALGVDQRLGVAATSLDTAARSVALSDGSTLAYDAVVIATGASPRPFPALSGPGVHVLRTDADARALAADARAAGRLTILGAGFVGCEVAATLRGEGLDVDLVEALPFPLSRVLGNAVGEHIAGLHAAAGVRLHLGSGVTSIRGEGAARVLVLASGVTVPAAAVLAAIGVAPETGWLAGSGVEVADGIICDEHGRTSVPGVWAAGDVARWRQPALGEAVRYEHWTSASDQGLAVAADLAGDPVPLVAVPYFWSDQYGTRWQMLGRSGPDHDVTLLRVGPGGDQLLAVYGKDGRFTAVLGGGVPRLVLRMRALLAEGATYDAALERARS
jgi:NADPH-dependent 2,4-dienoyl-CoA reductase/sulfur reductase-like enzyme